MLQTVGSSNFLYFFLFQGLKAPVSLWVIRDPELAGDLKTSGPLKHGVAFLIVFPKEWPKRMGTCFIEGTKATLKESNYVFSSPMFTHTQMRSF